jgi:hypothetical protein
MTTYISTTETAALVRKALKEAFPGVKFSVRSSSYAGGASISVGWTDGPNKALVVAITERFEASYFDGMIDYKGACYHMLDGVRVIVAAKEAMPPCNASAPSCARWTAARAAAFICS